MGLFAQLALPGSCISRRTSEPETGETFQGLYPRNEAARLPPLPFERDRQFRRLLLVNQ